jgi:AraC family transcriptional regulator
MKLPSGRFYGTRIKSGEAARFAFVEAAYLPNQVHPNHSHERSSFCLVLRGNFTETYGRDSLTCSASTLLFYPAGEVHMEHFHKAGTRCFIIEVQPSWLEQLRQYSILVDQAANFHGGKIPGLAMRAYQEFCALDEFSPLSIEGFMLEMIAEISRYSQRLRNGRPIARIELVRELIHERFSESLTLIAISELVGLHPVYVAQAFRKAYGSTVGEYTRRLRIESACRELSKLELPIARIAANVGFFDQSHFTRTFRRLVGVTPAEYRKTLSSH